MEKELTIVIISMNNLPDLQKCLDSIFEVSGSLYKISVIAFAFTDENLSTLKKTYGDKISIVETGGVKGFAENNNEALKLVTTQYCMVLNDDTYFTDNSIGKLLTVIKANDNIKILSPHILNFDGSSQVLGRPKYHVFNYFLHELKLIKYGYHGNTADNLFKTYNISGACFVIETTYFKELGFFDEKYFFTPEDYALSTKSIQLGNYPYVLKEATVYHKGSSTAKKIHQVTIPVAKQGVYMFFAEFYGALPAGVVRSYIFLLSSFKYVYWLAKGKSDRRNTMLSASANCIKYAFKSIPPKSLFIKLREEVKS